MGAARALETSRLEQEKRTLETSKKELAEIQEKGPDNTTKKASLIAPEKNDSLEINVNLAGPLPSEIPLMDAPVTKPRVNKQEEPQKKHVEDEARQTKPSKNHTDRRRSGKLTITQALGDETSRH